MRVVIRRMNQLVFQNKARRDKSNNEDGLRGSRRDLTHNSAQRLLPSHLGRRSRNETEMTLV